LFFVSFIAALATALLLPGVTAVANGPDGGRVLSGTFPGAARPGDVYLPPGFTTSGRYPVVYLLHGMPGSPSEFIQGTGLLEWADAAIADGTVQPFIAVMPAAGTRPRYNGEWAGPWERMVVDDVVPWVDSHLPTIATRRGRTLAGLSAGGFGAFDIGLRHPRLFGTIESWSGYFTPLHDGPFKGAPQSMLAANDPQLLVRSEAAQLVHDGTRFFVATGPNHSHWFKAAQTLAFARELRSLQLPVDEVTVAQRKGEWRAQMSAGLTYALSA
jgi:enterochelin esterase-like enzyme